MANNYVLPLDDIVRIVVNLSPRAALRRGFNLGLFVGTATVIPIDERVRLYSSTQAMFDDGFRDTDPEYIAAQIMFSQRPAPTRIAVGRHNDIGATLGEWDTTITNNNGDTYALSWEHLPAEGNTFVYQFADVMTNLPTYGQTLDNTWVAITNGDSVTPSSNLGIIIAEVTPQNTVVNISAALFAGGSVSLGLPVAESVTDAIRLCRAANTEWYLFTYLGATPNEILNLARWAEVAQPVCVQFYTTDEDLVLGNDPNNIFAKIRALSLRRSLGQFSRTPYAVAGIMGYAMGQTSRMSRSAYTLIHKRVVGVVPDNLSLTQVDNLQRNNANYYVSRGFDSEYMMFERGTLGDGVWFDEVIFLDMLVNDMQLGILDLLTRVPKVPQTESGMLQIINAMRPSLRTMRMIGFIAPGRWNAPSIYTEPDYAPLQEGDFLEDGYLILHEPIDYQSQADREARVAPPIYVPVKLAGAIHTVLVRIDVNR